MSQISPLIPLLLLSLCSPAHKNFWNGSLIMTARVAWNRCRLCPNLLHQLLHFVPGGVNIQLFHRVVEMQTLVQTSRHLPTLLSANRLKHCDALMV